MARVRIQVQLLRGGYVVDAAEGECDRRSDLDALEARVRLHAREGDTVRTVTSDAPLYVPFLQLEES